MDQPASTSRVRLARAVLHGPLLAGLLVATVLAGLVVGPQAAKAASGTYLPACSAVNIRTSASLGAAIKTRLTPSDTVTVVATVSGSSWSAVCPTSKSGSGWYRISAINGTSVRTLYGVSYLYGATGVLKAAPAPAPTPTATPSPTPAPSATPSPTPTPAPTPAPAANLYLPACSAVNIRTSASLGAAIKTRLTPSDTVTVVATVSGSSWSAVCPTSKSGSGWYRISAINGTSVRTLYGVSYLYGATGVLKAAPAPAPTPTATPSPTPAPSATPSPTPTPAPTPAPAANLYLPACSAVNIRTSASLGAAIKTRLTPSDTVTVVATVSGSSWSAVCPTSKSGSGWYRISAINGTSVRTLYGVSYLYGATGVLKAAPAPAPTPTATPSPTPAPSATPSPTPTPAPTPAPGISPIGSSTTFYGRGYGHGVGLSQYGARGRALAGQTAAGILAHYYAGTTIGTLASGTSIRVLLLDNLAASQAIPLTVFGRGGGWGIRGNSTVYPADARLRLMPPAAGTGTQWRMIVDDTTGAVLADAAAPADLTVEPRDSGTTLQLYSKPSTYDLYRGTLRAILGTSTADVVNEVGLEDYLRGVVPAEMPTSWPLEARLAQTIAARSYAAYRLRPGVSTFDVYDDTRSQVYQGARRESAASDAAVTTTAAQILRSGSAIANALFHSTAGGATENNENVFVSSTGAKVAGAVSYLRGSSDRDPTGAAYDAAAPYATWQTHAYTAAALTAIFNADSRTSVGTLTGLDLRDRGVSGRLISVTLVGSQGTKKVSGDVFVAVFNAGRAAGDPPLRSTLLDLAPIP